MNWTREKGNSLATEFMTLLKKNPQNFSKEFDTLNSRISEVIYNAYKQGFDACFNPLEKALEEIENAVKEVQEEERKGSFKADPPDYVFDVIKAAQRFCEEVQEDADGVPQNELKKLHEALDAWEAATTPPDTSK